MNVDVTACHGPCRLIDLLGFTKAYVWSFLAGVAYTWNDGCDKIIGIGAENAVGICRCHAGRIDRGELVAKLDITARVDVDDSSSRADDFKAVAFVYRIVGRNPDGVRSLAQSSDCWIRTRCGCIRNRRVKFSDKDRALIFRYLIDAENRARRTGIGISSGGEAVRPRLQVDGEFARYLCQRCQPHAGVPINGIYCDRCESVAERVVEDQITLGAECEDACCAKFAVAEAGEIPIGFGECFLVSAS